MHILADELVERVGLGRASPPDDWVSRRLYCGDELARGFLEAASDPSYAEHAHGPYGLREFCREAVARVGARTVVSFGPGDGGFEAELVRLLKEKEPGVAYIPVDLSRVILETAGARVARVAPVPVGLLADFECGEALLRDVLDQYAAPPVLFLMLGCTVANLDLGESNFFGMMRRLMRPGDAFLFDLPLYGPAWRPENDPRLNSRAYAESLKRFLAGGLVDREPALALDDVARWFDDRIACEVRPGGEAERSKLFVVFDQRTGRHLLRIRLYEWQSMQDWLRSFGFDIPFARCSLASDRDELGMGAVLLSHRGAGRPSCRPRGVRADRDQLAG